jgi:hypothetical protein
MTNKKYPVLYDITFYLTDEDGNEVLNEDGTTKQYKIKEGLRYKPLEYIAEELDLSMLEEI